MRFLVFVYLIIFLLNIIYSQKVTTPDTLVVNERWNDDFITDFRRGNAGWSMQGDYMGINTTIEYHGFYADNNDILFRRFTFNDEGTCDISFNLVFGCLPSNNDSIIFEVTNINNINNGSKTIFYSETEYLDDIRVYYGKNELNSEPQCESILSMHGGYQIYYKHSYIINGNNKNIPFMISFTPNFIDNSITNRYYGVYNVSIFCTQTKKLYFETHFLGITQLGRYLILWVIGGIIILFVFILIMVIMCQRICCQTRVRAESQHDQLIQTINPAPPHRLSKARGAQSITITAQSAADIFRQLKTLRKKPLSVGYPSPIIDENEPLEDTKFDEIKNRQISDETAHGYDTTIHTSANFSKFQAPRPQTQITASWGNNNGNTSYNTIIKKSTVTIGGNDSIPLMTDQDDSEPDGATIDTESENDDDNNASQIKPLTHLDVKKTKKGDVNEIRQSSVKM